MKVVPVYFEDSQSKTVELSENILSVDSGSVNSNKESLDRRLKQKRQSDPTIMGICDFRIGIILFSKDNTFECEVYSSKTVVSGTWSVY